jgi:hypothetical protein
MRSVWKFAIVMTHRMRHGRPETGTSMARRAQAVVAAWARKMHADYQPTTTACSATNTIIRE